MRERILRILKFWLPVLLWMIIIFNLSNQRLPSSSSEYWVDFIFKKCAHLFFYGVLATLFYRAIYSDGIKKKSALYLSVFLSFLYGITDEFHQSFIAGREPTLRDIIIDTIGASIAAFLIYYLLPKFPKRIKVVLEKLGLE